MKKLILLLLFAGVINIYGKTLNCDEANDCLEGGEFKFNTMQDGFVTSGCARGDGDCGYLTKITNKCNQKIYFKYCLEKNDGTWSCGGDTLGIGKSDSLPASTWTYNVTGKYILRSFSTNANYKCFENWKKDAGVVEGNTLKQINAKDGMIGLPNKNYEIDVTEVTVAQFEKCVKARGCQDLYFATSSLNYLCNYDSENESNPMNCITWYGADEYCKWKGKRLPTVEEWIFAAKGGENYEYSGSNNPNDIAWYSKNSKNSTHKVATKKANGYGFYDMTGNVWEWTDTTRETSLDYFILGGAFDTYPIKISKTSYAGISVSNMNIGFRCARIKKEGEYKTENKKENKPIYKKNMINETYIEQTTIEEN